MLPPSSSERTDTSSDCPVGEGGGFGAVIVGDPPDRSESISESRSVCGEGRRERSLHMDSGLNA
jgi:hypothetical protein